MAAVLERTTAAQRLALIAALANGRVHGAGALAAAAGLDEARLPGAVDALDALGLEVLPSADGFRLPAALELLDAGRIRSALTTRPALAVRAEVDSTNTAVRDLLFEAGRAAVCLGEYQHAGRGRLGRRWVVPFGSGVCFSTAWRSSRRPVELAGLSLAIGVAVQRALADSGVAGVALKWPNDVLLGAGKLGGILVELGTAGAGTTVIVGVGINARLSPAALAAVRERGGEPATLADVAPGLGRNAVAAALIDAVIGALARFEAEGLDPFHDAWNALHAMRDAPVRLTVGSERVDGVARGIDASGALLVDTADGQRAFAGGEVSLRRLSDAAD